MHPVLLKIGPFTVHSYGVLLAVAFLAAAWEASRRARKHPSSAGIRPEQVIDLTCVGLLGGVLGARLFFVAQNWNFFSQVPQEIPALWHGGLVWYGGFAGGLLAAKIYVLIHRLSFLKVVDHMAPALALGHAIGRIGCFFNGCCHGHPTEAWWGVRFVGQETAVVPVQLIESAGLFILFFVLRRLQEPAASRRPGSALAWYLILYGVLRFSLEWLRADQPVLWGGLTVQQVLSAALIAGGIFLIAKHYRKA